MEHTQGSTQTASNREANPVRQKLIPKRFQVISEWLSNEVNQAAGRPAL